MIVGGVIVGGVIVGGVIVGGVIIGGVIVGVVVGGLRGRRRRREPSGRWLLARGVRAVWVVAGPAAGQLLLQPSTLVRAIPKSLVVVGCLALHEKTAVCKQFETMGGAGRR